jgi:ubiquinone/menaquinone biosynthesis C-methylase UbiE
MNTEEYTNLNRVEGRHWYYAGKREIVRHWLNHYRPVNATATLLDCGAGTGAFAVELYAADVLAKIGVRGGGGGGIKVIAFNDHDESLEILRAKLGAENVVRGDCARIPLPDGFCDYLTALDVIEHVPDDAGAAHEFVRVLKPGGLAVITVPALQCLWSDWDVALHHHRRYNRPMLRKLLQAAGLRILHLNYINVAAFPAVWLVRKWRALRKQKNNNRRRMEDALPPAVINRVLKTLFVAPACQRLVPFPFGVGSLAVAEKT